MTRCFIPTYRLLLLSASLLWAFSLQAQHQEERTLSDFNKIEFTGRGDLFLRQGGTPTLQIKTPDDIDQKRIITEVRDNTLVIEYDWDEDDWLDAAPKLELHITYPELRGIEVTGLAHIESPDLIESDRFVLDVEGMGRIDLALDVADLEITSAGTTNINISGKANEVRILNNGTGTIDAFRLISQEADVEVNGTGTVRVNTTERLWAEANGFGAEVKYRGEPKKTHFDKSGFASIKADY
uniref:DUF2807 domain-containing protein n=1 Tax=Roseihalotalea indica TaxID=2867963 RepID=A0AA49JFQ3_9BACT|nr:DUF2807 domain-containing protein [Tunicatimonas sp. TK19036]